MSKKLSYKQLVKNSVDLQIYKFLNKRCNDRYFEIENITIVNDDLMRFTAFIKVNNGVMTNEYTLHGYIDEYCQIDIYCVYYERLTSVLMENGEYTEPKKRLFWVYDKDIEIFKFEK